MGSGGVEGISILLCRSVPKLYGHQPRDHSQLGSICESASSTCGSNIGPSYPPQPASPRAFKLSADIVNMRTLCRDVQIPSVSTHRLTQSIQGLLYQGGCLANPSSLLKPAQIGSTHTNRPGTTNCKQVRRVLPC